MSNPVEVIRGLLKSVKKSGVELQHEAGEIRAARWNRYRRVEAKRD